MLARVRELWPEVSVVASHQITREWREYERTSTAVLSAYVQPVAERYLTRLAAGVREAGFDGQLYIMQSNCGVDSVEKTKEIPITMVESGPASGFWGAAELGRLIGEPNVLALDIGGTTAKCSLIEGGHVKVISDYWIERSRLSAGYPIMVPVVDLVEIGNGGGSIAWVDDFGKLHVGPALGRRRARAPPPTAAAAPRRRRPTRISSSGGSTATTSAAARSTPTWTAVGRALDEVAGRLGVDRAEAARGIVRIANNNMVNALKLISVNRGYDPRDFTLVAFGGGGGMHAVALAAELGIRKVVIPRAADVFSAWGMLMSDLRRDYFLTRLLDVDAGERRAARGRVRRARRPRRSTSSRREGIAAEQVTFRRSRQPALREPGARRRDRAARRLDRRVRGRGDRALLPRVLRARVHLPARRAGRVRRRPSDRGRRGRQARARRGCR